jgi:hypothetical protein
MKLSLFSLVIPVQQASNNILIKTISLTLMFSLLINSVNAAPTTIISSAREFSQDIRFAFISSSIASNFYNLLHFSFFKLNNSPVPTSVASIQVFPGSVTIQQGEKVTFSAIAFDSNEDPISGVELDWEVTEVGLNLPYDQLKSSTFEGRIVGTFLISAKSNGIQTQATIIVEPSAEFDPDLPSLSAMPTKVISSRDDLPNSQDKKNKNPDKKDENITSENSQNSQNSLPDEGYWNSSNWSSFDDPGNQTGNPTGSPADDGAGNGNFQLSAPVVSLPGRGIDLALNLNYNSRLWNKSLTQASSTELTYDIDRGSPAPGWSLGFGKMMDMGTDGGSMLVDADGTRHGYTGSISSGGSNQYSYFKGFTADGKFIDYNSSRDAGGIYAAYAQFPNGTAITYAAKGEGAVYPTLITDAQGNQINITYRGNAGPKINTITDTIGRVITFQYDSSNRLISVQAPRSQEEDPVYGSAKRRTLLRLHYKPHTLNYSFASGVIPIVRQQTFDVIDSIYYPATNTGYWFNDTDSYSSYGMLTKVVEQRGMTWSGGIIGGGVMTKQALYNYPLTVLNESGRTNGIGLSDAPTYTTLTESWDGMDVAEPSITTYLFNNNTTYTYTDGGITYTPNARLVQVTQPNGTISKQYSSRAPNFWTDGLVFADETIVSVNSVPTIISSSLVNWEQGDYHSPRPDWAKITDENGKKVKTDYEYTGGNFNQVTRSCDYDDSNVKLRCANTTYENSQNYKGTWISQTNGSNVEWYYSGGRHIFNLVLSTTIENPDGTIVSKTDYEYDGNPLADTLGVIQHAASHNPSNNSTVICNCHWSCDGNLTNSQNVIENCPDGTPPLRICDQCPVYNSSTQYRGNVTKVTNYSDAANPATSISSTNEYDITGNLIKASTSCCQQTSYQI